MPFPVFLFLHPAVSTTALNLHFCTCYTDGYVGGVGVGGVFQLIQVFPLYFCLWNVSASKHYLYIIIFCFLFWLFFVLFFFCSSLMEESSFGISVRRRTHVTTSGRTSASPSTPELRGWGLQANAVLTTSSGNMYPAQMWMYPSGKVRRKRPVRLVKTHSWPCNHSLNMLLLALIQSALAKEHSERHW